MRTQKDKGRQRLHPESGPRNHQNPQTCALSRAPAPYHRDIEAAATSWLLWVQFCSLLCQRAQQFTSPVAILPLCSKPQSIYPASLEETRFEDKKKSFIGARVLFVCFYMYIVCLCESIVPCTRVQVSAEATSIYELPWVLEIKSKSSSRTNILNH